MPRRDKVTQAPMSGNSSSRALMVAVGCLIVALSLFQLGRIFKLI